ncbi:hypothetical protein ISCGN_019846 [Ixodes scapularis]
MVACPCDSVPSTLEDASVSELPRLTLIEKPVPDQMAVEMNGRPGGPVFLVHPIEGHVGSLSELARQLPVRSVGLQRTRDVPARSIEEAAIYLQIRRGCKPGHPRLPVAQDLRRSATQDLRQSAAQDLGRSAVQYNLRHLRRPSAQQEKRLLCCSMNGYIPCEPNASLA